MALIVSWVAVTVFLVVIGAISVHGSVLPTGPASKIRLNFLRDCPDGKKYPDRLDNLTFFDDPETGKFYAEGLLTVTEEVPKDSMMKVDFRKCYNEKQSSCEKYLVTDVKTFCKELADDSRSWSNFMHNIDGFDNHCPLKPGIYNIIEAPIDMTPFEALTEYTGHWEIWLWLIHEQTILGCTIFDVDVYLNNNIKKKI